jgi:NAD-dependent deacetylase
MNPKIQELAHLIKNRKYVVVFTGAGISTESGLPDFSGSEPRDEAIQAGPLHNMPESPTFEPQMPEPQMPEIPRVESSQAPDLVPNTYASSDDMGGIRPNRTHEALVTLQNHGMLNFVITMNLDGLHRVSGIRSEKLVEVHGNVFLVKCTECNLRYQKAKVGWDNTLHGRGFLTEPEYPNRPKCPRCGGKLISTEINYGDPMPDKEWGICVQVAKRADLFIAMGTSLSTYPANTLPDYCLANQGKFVIINKSETPLDSKANIIIRDNVGEIMGELLKILNINHMLG